MRLEDAIKSERFGSEKHKATLNVIFTAYWLKDNAGSALKTEGLTIEQFNVLRILMGAYPEPYCVKDIASRIIEKSSNVPRIIDRLVTKKLVKRSTSKADKRETLISLTDTGITILEKANKLVNDVNASITNITEAEAQQLNMLLEKLRQV
jgi:DNA-binding MarR family transcriptional regulator